MGGGGVEDTRACVSTFAHLLFSSCFGFDQKLDYPRCFILVSQQSCLASPVRPYSTSRNLKF